MTDAFTPRHEAPTYADELANESLLRRDAEFGRHEAPASRLTDTLNAASAKVAENPERAAEIRANWTDGHEAPAEGAGEFARQMEILRKAASVPVPDDDSDFTVEKARRGSESWRVIASNVLREYDSARSSAPEAREGEAVGPDSFSAEGKFFLAVDYLTLMTWRWGESCGIESVGWDDTGDSYNQSCRDDHRKARRAVVDAFHAAVAEKIAAHPDAPSADKLRIAVEALERIAHEPRPVTRTVMREHAAEALAALKAEGA